MAVFYVIQGNDQGRYFVIDKTITSTIGRDSNNQIQLRDVEVSRKHASIFFKDGEFHLIDNESTNRIYVNETCEKHCILNNGDEIWLGQTLLLFARNPSDDSTLCNQFSDLPHGKELLPDKEIKERHGEKIAFLSSLSDDDFANFFTKLSSNPQLIGHLKVMYQTSLITSQTSEVSTLLSRMMELIADWAKISRGYILIYDQETLQLTPKIIYPPLSKTDSDTSDTILRFIGNQEIVDQVTTKREGVRITDFQTTENHKTKAWDIICVPMLGRYGFWGVIYIEIDIVKNSKLKVSNNFRSNVLRLNDAHFHLMNAIAHQAALVIEDTRYYKGMVHAEHLAAVGQTVSTISHHIKNILQGINGGSHLIQTGLDRHNEDLIRQGWNIVKKNQNRISQLIFDMLTFSKEREPTYELSDIVETVKDVIELMGSRAKEESVEIVLQVKGVIPQFYFDTEQIHRVITNIVINGIDATKLSVSKSVAKDIDTKIDTLISKPIGVEENLRQKGLIQIQIDYDSKREIVMITVEDNGHGIPLSQKKYLFRPFYSQKRGRGTGLGLSVAYKVVQEHGGTIRINDSIFGGAKFEIELPFHFAAPPKKTDNFDEIKEDFVKKK